MTSDVNIQTDKYKKYTVMTVSGIRPDFIRMSYIFKELDKHFNHILVHTGQHYDQLLSDVFFNDLSIRKPDYVLHTGSNSSNHYEQLSYLTINLMKLLKDHVLKPDIILFLGDSNSVCVSLPLKKEGYKIGHIEAGMRSYDKRMFEEINRTVCDHCSDILFVYNEEYKQHLKNENITDNVFVVGNTIIEPCNNIIKQYITPSMKKRNDMILVDIHRRENFNDVNRMIKILAFCNLCKIKYKLPVRMLCFKGTLDCVYNPTNNINLGEIEIISLQSYINYIMMTYHSKFVISDSGTAVEELPLLNTPVICPRDYTERPMSYTSNCSYKLCLNNNKGTVVCGVDDTYDDVFNWIDTYETRTKDLSWLGNGDTSTLVVEHLKTYLSNV